MEYEKKSLFANLSKSHRQLLFYGVCIWVRLFIIYCIYKFWNNRNFRIIFIGILLASIWRLLSTIDQNVWWSKRFHLVIASILVFFFFTSLFISDTKLKYSVVFILILDLIVGITVSFFNFS
jgi:hypothetical protein